MVLGRTIPYNSMFLWGGEDNAVTFSTCWEYVFQQKTWFMLRLNPESSEPTSRATSCSAISEDNEVFVFGGQPLATPRHGALGQALNDLWVFNVSCPTPKPVMQPIGAVVPDEVFASIKPVPYREAILEGKASRRIVLAEQPGTSPDSFEALLNLDARDGYPRGLRVSGSGGVGSTVGGGGGGGDSRIGGSPVLENTSP